MKNSDFTLTNYYLKESTPAPVKYNGTHSIDEPPYVVRLSLFKLYFILIYSYSIRYLLYPKLIII